MRPISSKRHRFPPDVIRYAVWLYFRFTLSIRDVEELLAQRGIEVSREPSRPVFFGRVRLQLQATQRYAAVAIWFASLAAVAIFASGRGLVVGLPVLLAAGIVTIGRPPGRAGPPLDGEPSAFPRTSIRREH